MKHTTSFRWDDYYTKTKNKPPSSLLTKAILHLNSKQSALDLGSGSGNDALFLLKAGFSVTAVDINTNQLSEIKKKFPMKLKVINKSFEDYNPEPKNFDLINAQWSIPFVSRNVFFETFSKQLLSLKKGGVFTGQLFGLNDGWNKNGSKLTFLSKPQVLELFSEMELLFFEEKESWGLTTLTEKKYWHVFHIIARSR